LVGIRYEQLLPLVLPYQNPENAFRVISDFVTTKTEPESYTPRQPLVLMMPK
jgi:hypothetical protein